MMSYLSDFVNQTRLDDLERHADETRRGTDPNDGAASPRYRLRLGVRRWRSGIVTQRQAALQG